MRVTLGMRGDGLDGLDGEVRLKVCIECGERRLWAVGCGLWYDSAPLTSVFAVFLFTCFS